MPHDKYSAERTEHLAKVAHYLHAAHNALQQARSINHAFELNLELPHEQQFIDAINTCAAAHRKETI